MNKQQYITTTVIGLAMYLIATGLSYAVFTSGITIPKKATPQVVFPTANPTGGRFVIDPSIPRDQICPLNGKMYTTQEKDTWVTRRPLAVMIENHVDARPQSGLSYADIVYEAVAEGGITRFMGIYYCGASAVPLDLAPVRSARTYFLPWVLEYDALYNHVGGAGCDASVDPRARALCQIEDWKIKDLNQFSLGVKTKDKTMKLCARNDNRLGRDVATEHTMVCNTGGLYNEAERRGWTNVDSKGVSWDKNFQSWKFKDDAKESERGTNTKISFVAWEGYEKNFGVTWEYDKLANVYKRTMGGSSHTDLATKEQITAKNVVVLFAKEIATGDEHAHLLYNNIGNGEGIFFTDGTATNVTWKKATRNARTVFYDAKTNKEMTFTRGEIWIEMLPTGTTVTY